MDTIRPIIWEDNTLKLLDQRILPNQYEYIDLTEIRAVADAITDMVVRGAPAIGITAAYGIVLAAQTHYRNSPNNWRESIQEDLQYLAASRPTAVNLFWAIDQMKQFMADINNEDPYPVLLKEAIRIHDEDIAANKTMGKFGASLIEQECAVLTHCNAGALATGGYGTALGVIRSGWDEGKIKHVYADETRPWLQGARLTAWEMVQEKIPVSLLVEGAASHIIRESQNGDKPIRWIIVGSDRIAANGDVANKIGTFGLAILAKYHGIKFMVAAPTTTIDMAVSHGKDIPIEERNTSEVLSLADYDFAAPGALARNPAFDVTPAELVDAIVTEKGIVLNPTTEKIKTMMGS